ncbi:hypothetical protein [Micromonospora sp. DT233]|uniref:hypothetical protein n=1 Tax=Micromonospora sp. DT233 TaxID=3393432 RepID=UPI003CE9F662
MPEHRPPGPPRPTPPPVVREHLPVRPIWLCRVCGGPWPCSPARAHLRQEYAGCLVTLAVHLAGLMLEADDELNRLHPYTAPPPGMLHHRFLGWLRPRAPRSASVGDQEVCVKVEINLDANLLINRVGGVGVGWG